jgi:hypothetical protein
MLGVNLKNYSVEIILDMPMDKCSNQFLLFLGKLNG